MAHAQSGQMSKKQKDSLDRAYEKKLEMLTHGQDSLKNSKIPAITFTTTDGKHFPEDFKGKILVLNFYATWCGPCRKEMPELNELKSEFANDSVEFVSFCSDCDSISIKNFLAHVPFNYRSVVNPDAKKMLDIFYITSYPTNIITGKNGEFILFESGYSNLIVKQMRKELKKQLHK
jgi:thiol-disulfide isomerase/thioredoxin